MYGVAVPANLRDITRVFSRRPGIHISPKVETFRRRLSGGNTRVSRFPSRLNPTLYRLWQRLLGRRGHGQTLLLLYVGFSVEACRIEDYHKDAKRARDLKV